MVSYVACLPNDRASRFMYGSHVGWILCVLYVVGLGSFLCSWVVRRIKVVMSVDRVSSRLLPMCF